MIQVRWFYPVLMIPSLVVLPSGGAGDYNKSVCSGDSVQVFDSVQIKDNDTSATLYKNGDKYRMLGRWTSSHHTFTEPNLVMDENKNIWIIKAHTLDEGLYLITYDIPNGPPLETTVRLSVLVAPNENCTIVVTEQGIILTVSLSGKDCGKPRASVYWKNSTGVTVHDEKVLQLQSGKVTGTYFACMKGPALSCSKNVDPSSDHCHPYNVNHGLAQSGTGESKIQLSSDGSKDDMHIVIISLQCAALGLVISFGIYRVYKKNGCSCKEEMLNKGLKSGKAEGTNSEDQGEEGDVLNATDQKQEEGTNSEDQGEEGDVLNSTDQKQEAEGTNSEDQGEEGDVLNATDQKQEAEGTNSEDQGEEGDVLNSTDQKQEAEGTNSEDQGEEGDVLNATDQKQEEIPLRAQEQRVV